MALDLNYLIFFLYLIAWDKDVIKYEEKCHSNVNKWQWSEKEDVCSFQHCFYYFVLWLKITGLLKINFHRATATDPLLELGNFIPA